MAQGHVKMTSQCNICFEYRLTLKVIKLAIFQQEFMGLKIKKDEWMTARIQHKFKTLFYFCIHSPDECSQLKTKPKAPFTQRLRKTQNVSCILAVHLHKNGICISQKLEQYENGFQGVQI